MLPNSGDSISSAIVTANSLDKHVDKLIVNIDWIQLQLHLFSGFFFTILIIAIVFYVIQLVKEKENDL